MQLSQTKAEIQTLKLSQIPLEAALQTRVVMSPKKVADYQQAYNNGSEFPPVLVAKQVNKAGDVKYSLLDGFHRIQALINNGVSLSTKVNVRIIEVPLKTTVHQLRYLGARENIKNGLSLTSPDKRELFRTYVKSKSNRSGNRYKSYRSIAADLLLIPHQTIARWMRSDFPAIATLMGKEFEDNYEDNANPDGGGVRIVDTPDLSSRERDIFASVLIAEAKDSHYSERGKILEWARQLLISLELEAPQVIIADLEDRF